jgi:hypothetical protein
VTRCFSCGSEYEPSDSEKLMDEYRRSSYGETQLSAEDYTPEQIENLPLSRETRNLMMLAHHPSRFMKEEDLHKVAEGTHAVQHHPDGSYTMFVKEK